MKTYKENLVHLFLLIDKYFIDHFIQSNQLSLITYNINFIWWYKPNINVGISLRALQFILWYISQAYPEPCETSKTERFRKALNVYCLIILWILLWYLSNLRSSRLNYLNCVFTKLMIAIRRQCMICALLTKKGKNAWLH